MNNRTFDYFYGTEHENYLFLQLPTALIKDDKFKGLSDSSKILYSLLLNRTSLSIKNGWMDSEKRVYIIYPIDEIMENLNCWKEKATKLMNELKEIGLIKTVRQGLNKPNLTYVMNFSTELTYQRKEKKDPKTTEKPLKGEDNLPREVSNSQQQINKNTDIPIADIAGNTGEFGNRTSKSSKIEPEEIRKSNPTNINGTKNNVKNTDVSIDQAVPKTETPADQPTAAPIDTIDTKNGKKVITVLTKAELEDKISFAELKDKYPDNIEDLEMIFDVLAEVMTVDNPVTPTLRISCQNTPFINVKTEFLKLGKSHIEYVLHSLDNNDNKHKITKNAKSYLMTSLFNAPRTINYYFDRNFSPKPKAKSDEYDVNALLERSIRNFRRNTL